MGRVGSGNLDPRATLGETNNLVCRSVNFYHCYIKLTCHTVMLTRTSVTRTLASRTRTLQKFIVKDRDKDFGLKDKDFGRNWSQGQSKDFKGRHNSKNLHDYI